MSLELYDTDFVEKELAAGEVTTLEVHTATAEFAEVLVDLGNGTNGTNGQKYNLTKYYYVPVVDDWMQVEEYTEKTAEQQNIDTYSADTRIEFENAGSSSQNFRVVLQAFRVY